MARHHRTPHGWRSSSEPAVGSFITSLGVVLALLVAAISVGGWLASFIPVSN